MLKGKVYGSDQVKDRSASVVRQGSKKSSELLLLSLSRFQNQRHHCSAQHAVVRVRCRVVCTVGLFVYGDKRGSYVHVQPVGIFHGQLRSITGQGCENQDRRGVGETLRGIIEVRPGFPLNQKLMDALLPIVINNYLEKNKSLEQSAK